MYTIFRKELVSELIFYTYLKLIKMELHYYSYKCFI